VQQGSKLVVDVVNEGDLETTVHWRGLHLDNRYDVLCDQAGEMTLEHRPEQRGGALPDPLP
jgi:multicopper oxidase